MIQSETKGFKRLYYAYKKQPDIIEKMVVIEVGTAIRNMSKSIRKTWQPHQKTRELHNSIFRDMWKKGNEVIGQVYSTVLHAIFMEKGTRKHTIRARKHPYLVFKIGDQWIRTKKVKHPGTSAVPAFSKAWLMYGKGFPRRMAGKIRARFRS